MSCGKLRPGMLESTKKTMSIPAEIAVRAFRTNAWPEFSETPSAATRNSALWPAKDESS